MVAIADSGVVTALQWWLSPIVASLLRYYCKNLVTFDRYSVLFKVTMPNPGKEGEAPIILMTASSYTVYMYRSAGEGETERMGWVGGGNEVTTK